MADLAIIRYRDKSCPNSNPDNSTAPNNVCQATALSLIDFPPSDHSQRISPSAGGRIFALHWFNVRAGVLQMGKVLSRPSDPQLFVDTIGVRDLFFTIIGSPEQYQ